MIYNVRFGFVRDRATIAFPPEILDRDPFRLKYKQIEDQDNCYLITGKRVLAGTFQRRNLEITEHNIKLRRPEDWS